MKKILFLFLVSTAMLLNGCIDIDDAMVTTGDNSNINSGDNANNSDSKIVEYSIVSNDLELYKDSLGGLNMIGVVVIENTGNTNLYLSDGKFDIEDADGNFIDTFDYISGYPEVIAPGEQGVYYESHSFDKGDASKSYVILPDLDVEESKVDLIRYPTTDVSLSDTDHFGVEVIGRVENTSAEEQNLVKVAVIMYGADGKPFSVQFTYTDDIKPGGKTSFETSGLMNRTFKTSDIATYSVYAYPTQFNF